MFTRPIVAFDGSEASRRALEAGCAISAKMGVALCTVTVIEGAPEYLSASGMAPLDTRTLDSLDEQRQAYADQLLAQVHEAAARNSISDVCAEADFGDPLDVIIDAINRHQCDLLIMGLRAHPGLVERLLPHTGRRLTDRAPCSVLGVR